MTIPVAPWTGRPAEVERTAEGHLIKRGPCGAFYWSPDGYWLPHWTAAE